MAHDYAEKIRALLANAEDPKLTEEARATYLAKAHDLMIKHSIDDAMLRAQGGPEVGSVIVRVWFKEDRMSMLIKAKRELSWGLADLHRCQVVLHGRNGRDSMSMIGFEVDLDHVETMFNSVMLQLQTDMEREAHTAILSGSLKSWKVSFAHGYVRRVIARLRDAQARQMAAATNAIPGSALVLRDQSALVKDKMGQLFPKLRMTKSTTSINSGDGYRRGDAAGARADLGGSRIGGTRGQLS